MLLHVFASLFWFSCHLLALACVCVCLCILLSGYSVCVYPSVHSLSPSLLPSVPLIPECVTNGRSRCSALLCSSPGESSSVCVCACIPLIGGLGAVSRGLSRILSSRRGGGKGSGGQAVPASHSLLLGFPWAQDPPLPFSPGDFRSLIASLSLSLSVSPQIHLLAAYIPTLLELCCSRWRGVARWLKNSFCVFWVYLYNIYKNGFVCLPRCMCVTVCLCFEQRAPAAYITYL